MNQRIKRQADLRRAVYILQNRPYEELKKYCDEKEITPGELHTKMIELDAFEKQIKKLLGEK